MPAPAVSPEFATDATFAAGSEDWSGEPNKVDPSAPVRAEGFIPDLLPAEHLNFMINNHGAWLRWLDDQLLASASRTIRFSPWTGYGAGTASPGTAPAFRSQVFSSGLTEGFNLVSNVDRAQWFLPLSDLLPDGSEVLTVTALVLPGAARTGANKIILTDHLHLVSFSGETSSFVSTNVDSTHADSDVSICKITHSLGITIDKPNSQLVVKLTCGNDAGTNEDRILGWEVTYTGRKWGAV
jgi:hypothetical protein